VVQVALPPLVGSVLRCETSLCECTLLSLFLHLTSPTRYDWNTLLVCWIAARQMGHVGLSICVSRFAHASHTHMW
jgi:hypothetical protein